ncbi:hypothetical protein JHK82_032517 [Glycine max]|uniref:Uncharacterized protein n=2 Tax=Glycine subgen. Soja TaxID=1462606 RepID=A0A0R0H0L7_SOYBN|nr:hypothetical protein JHK86_032612 [Glycine max]KAG5118097.1 hypothetical protein JHK82_032517 [Glycine max]KAH1141102.1 hypothetical protein GYH30_032391 [Glycine max]KRH23994.1 hypothetical protein GLYMA_12G015200v4 [Glycine max]RZB73755.1 hypothetical protein D0Y65_033071 [Glycine soja]
MKLSQIYINCLNLITLIPRKYARSRSFKEDAVRLILRFQEKKSLFPYNSKTRTKLKIKILYCIISVTDTTNKLVVQIIMSIVFTRM